MVKNIWILRTWVNLDPHQQSDELRENDPSKIPKRVNPRKIVSANTQCVSFQIYKISNFDFCEFELTPYTKEKGGVERKHL